MTEKNAVAVKITCDTSEMEERADRRQERQIGCHPPWQRQKRQPISLGKLEFQVFEHIGNLLIDGLNPF